MGLGVELLDVAGLDAVLNVLVELAAETLLIVVGKTLHVLGDVASEDVVAESLGVELLGLDVEAGEAVLGVGNVDTAVGGTLHGSEDTGTGGGTGKTNVKEGLEGTALAVVGLGGLGHGVLAVGLLNTGELLVEAELDQGTAGKEQTSGVGGSPVGQTVGDAIALELVGVGAGEDLVTGDLRVDDLSDDVAVGEADNQAVLGGVVLVLGLGDKALTGVVVGLTLSSAAVLGLVAAANLLASWISTGWILDRDLPEVRAALDSLVVRLQEDSRVSNSRFRNFVRSNLQGLVEIQSRSAKIATLKEMKGELNHNMEGSSAWDESPTHHLDYCRWLSTRMSTLAGGEKREKFVGCFCG